MDIRNRRALKEMARGRLATATYNPRKLALIHTAVSVGAALVIAALGYVLDHWIAGTASGLSGMGTRRILETVQMTLQYVQALALPFWEIGFVFVALRLWRQETVHPKDMLEGFRRFRQVLGLRLTEFFLYFGVAIGCMYAASFLFAFTPYSQKMINFLMPYVEEGAAIEQIQEVLVGMPAEELLAMSVPFMVMFAIVFLVVFLWMHYKFRLASHLVMDQPNIGAMRALFFSSQMTRKKRWALLKLDLSFWWFYVLMGLSVVVYYMDVLLPMMGIPLSISGDVAWLVFYVLSLLVQLVVFWWGKSYVQTTWAAAYETLCRQLEEPKMPEKQPEANLPWDQYETE